MAKLNIKSFGDKFAVVDAAGNPFNTTLYSTERGAKQAISKAGHTYDSPKVEPKAKTGKTKQNETKRVDMSEDAILELRDDCLAAAGYKPGMTSEQVKALNWAEANRVAVAGGFSSYFALKQVAKGVKWSRKPQAEKESIARGHEDRAADKAAIESGEMSEDVARARNALAKVNGFPRYRELERAAARGDSRAKAVKATIDKTVPFAKVASKSKAA